VVTWIVAIDPPRVRFAVDALFFLTCGIVKYLRTVPFQFTRASMQAHSKKVRDVLPARVGDASDEAVQYVRFQESNLPNARSENPQYFHLNPRPSGPFQLYRDISDATPGTHIPPLSGGVPHIRTREIKH